MSFSIRVPNSALHKQNINIANSAYNISFKYNTSDEAWYLQLLTLDDEVLTPDLKIMPNQNITGRFPYLNPLPNGNIWCLRVKNDFSPITRTNLGVDKTYELVYLTTQEEIDLDYYGTIQL